MSTRRALVTIAVASFLVLGGLPAGVTGTAAAGNTSETTVFDGQPSAYQSDAGESDTTVREGESVTVDVPVTDETIDPDSAYGENWTHYDAPETIDSGEQVWTSRHAIGDRFIDGYVDMGGQHTVDEVTIETGGNLSELYIVLGNATQELVDVTDGTATVSVENVQTDDIVFFEKDDQTTDPLTIVDVRASNDGVAINRSGWSTHVRSMESLDVSEALDDDSDPWTSPAPMSDGEYGITKVFSGEKRIDGVTVEHDGQDYPSNLTVTVLSSGGDLTKTVSTTGETTTIGFEAMDARTVQVLERDTQSSDPWTVTDLRYHNASTTTLRSVRVNASELGLGTVNATRGENGEYSATVTPAYSSIPDGTYTLPVTATDVNGTEYRTTDASITVDTQAPQFPSRPSVNDADGDGTVTSDETVTVTADFETTEPTISSVTGGHQNVSTAPEAMDGDETPWTSDHPVGDRKYYVEVQFASERQVDEIEIETSGIDSRLTGKIGYREDTVNVSNGSATMRLDDSTSASSFYFEETIESGADHWTVSDLNAYHDGQQLDESEWSVETYAINRRDVTSTFEDESATWSARSSVGDNFVWFTLGLSEPALVDELTIDHADGATPSRLSVFSKEEPFLKGVSSEGATTRIEIPLVRTETLYVYENAHSEETDWAVSDVTLSGPENDDIERVTVDASPLGAGTVEAQAVGPHTYEVTIEPDSSVDDGTYELDVIATDDAGNVETTQAKAITVETSDDSGSSGSSGSSSSPGGSTSSSGNAPTGGGGAIPVDDTDQPEMVVETVTINETTNVSITNAPADASVTIEPNETGESAGDVSAHDETVVLDAVHATVANDGNYSVAITENESPPAGAERFDVSDADSAVGYVQVDHAEDETFDDVTFEFRVSADALADRGIEPGEAALYRHSDGEWTTLDTSVVSQNDTWVAFEADSPGFSTFAVAAEPSPSISVTDADVSTAAVTAGDEVVVEAIVENDGTAGGESTIELTLDGERELTEEVSLDAGETATVTFETAIGEAGQYDVAVNGTSAGTLSVGTGTSTSTPTERATSVAEQDADGIGLMPVGAGILVLLGVVGAFRFLRG